VVDRAYEAGIVLRTRFEGWDEQGSRYVAHTWYP
jgi:hypothetical protein